MQTITYTLSLSGISPTDLQDGGVQRDHCKTALVFCPDEALWSDVSSDVSQNHNIRCRVDASDGAGGYHLYHERYHGSCQQRWRRSAV